MKNFLKMFSKQAKATPIEQKQFPSKPSDHDVRREYGVPPKIDDFFGDVSPTGSPHDPGWDYRLWVEEWAEPYLGTEQFTSLERRFALTPGVEEVAHMDREIFLIKTRMSPEQLRNALWPHFLEAAKEGSNT